MKLGHTEDEITEALDKANFNDSAVAQIFGNYFEKTKPTPTTLKKVVTVPDGSGVNRIDVLLDAYEKYDDSDPLLHE
jgi:hypothetical protein